MSFVKVSTAIITRPGCDRGRFNVFRRIATRKNYGRVTCRFRRETIDVIESPGIRNSVKSNAEIDPNRPGQTESARRPDETRDARWAMRKLKKTVVNTGVSNVCKKKKMIN